MKKLTLWCGAFVVVLLSVVGAFFAGPLCSGALFLLLPTATPAAAHDLPDRFQAAHQGSVDLGTGLYVRRDEDLALRGTPSFVFRRAYLSGDRVPRPFGVGATNSAECYLIGDPVAFHWAEMILEDGGRIHFARVSRGTSCANALFEHHATPTWFDGASLGWTGFGWAMRLRDGRLALFRACGADGRPCSLTRLRDSDGHWTTFSRDSNDLLRRIETPREWISLEYDIRRRVVRASDSAGDRVDYGYDDKGRLIRATYSDGVVRAYRYDSRDRMVSIDEPGRVVENEYDLDDRLVNQVVHLRPQWRSPACERVYRQTFAYRVNRGTVVQTDLSEADGTRTRVEFNAAHYEWRRTFRADGPAPITVTFDRNPANNVATAFTVACTNEFGAATHTFEMAFEREDDAVSRAVARLCGTRGAPVQIY